MNLNRALPRKCLEVTGGKDNPPKRKTTGLYSGADMCRFGEGLDLGHKFTMMETMVKMFIIIHIIVTVYLNVVQSEISCV